MTENSSTENVQSEIVGELVFTEPTGEPTTETVAAETTEPESATPAPNAEENSAPEYYVPTLPVLPTEEELEIRNGFHKKVYRELASSYDFLPEIAEQIAQYNKGKAEIDPRLEVAESESAAAFRKARELHAEAQAKRDAEKAAEIAAIVEKFAAAQKESDDKLAEVKAVAVKELTGEASISDDKNTENLLLWQEVSEDIADKAERLVNYGYEKLAELVIPTGSKPVVKKKVTVKSSGGKGNTLKPRMDHVLMDGAIVGDNGKISAVDLAKLIGIDPDDLKAEIMRLSNMETGNGTSNSDRTGWDKLTKDQKLNVHLNSHTVVIQKRFV